MKYYNGKYVFKNSISSHSLAGFSTTISVKVSNVFLIYFYLPLVPWRVAGKKSCQSLEIWKALKKLDFVAFENSFDAFISGLSEDLLRLRNRTYGGYTLCERNGSMALSWGGGGKLSDMLLLDVVVN